MNPFQQTQKLLAKMEALQKALEEKEVKGESGAGLVSVVLNGKHEVKSVKIDPSLLTPDDAEMVEDLIVAAFRDAHQKVESAIAEEGSKMSAGMPRIPGMPLF